MAEQQRINALQKAQVETQQHSIADLRCPTCTYKFDTVRGYNFHRSKNICTKAQPPGLKFYCSNYKAAIPADWPADKREARLISLKNGNASRKSQIRKSFGVTLRMRDKDKEAKKRREIFSTNTHSPGDDRFENSYHSIPPISGYPVSTEQLDQRQHPNHIRMEMVDARPITGFSPINAQPQHQSHPQAQQGHQMTQYSVPPGTQGFLPSFPPLRSHSRPGQHISPYDNGPAPEQDYREEDYANKRMKRNSNAGMTREEERSRRFAPSDSTTPMHARGRSVSGSQVRGGVAGQDAFRTVRDGDRRPNSSGSNGVHSQENSARQVKRVPTKGVAAELGGAEWEGFRQRSG
ncbi:hypothetical protein DID88_001365 [Monilinia fructigena]|uniref:Uncharacterized protein n=1 Tax=Monilinia fructigena TaxID=38457 RepID=A0A395J3P7_9HELO|nr:hypothetical protein DID88_001365 [Monilinia fructigena]